MPPFAHLHLHSQYSLLDGANRLGDVTAAAAQAGMSAIALTDHGNMFGAIEFYDAAKKAGIKPIIGIEAYVARGSRHDRTQGNRGGGSNHLVLLAKNETGYRNLIKLTSKSYLEGFYYKPRMDKELLRQHAEGIIALSACLKGEVNERLIDEDEAHAEAAARELYEIFGAGNFYLELQNHGIAEQSRANVFLRRLAKRLGIPLVATNDTHYLRKSDAAAHDALLCIGTQRMLSDPDRMRYASDEFYLKTPEEMYDLFRDDWEALENTAKVAELCDLTIGTGKFHLPQFPVPAGYSLESYFREVARAGLEQRFDERRERARRGLVARYPEELYRERLDYELAVIEKMGFAGYFLVVWDFIRYSREHRIPVGPGRGSAAGSLVSYALRITDIDPLEYDLLFERFLNPDRISMPDIDIDFCMRRRGEVIDYVNGKYGRDHVAQIITFGTLAAKAVIRDVGRVMGIPYAKVDRIAKLVPDMTKSLAEAAKEVDALKTEAQRDEEVRQIIEIGSRLEGLTRHAGMHAAGVVIAPQPIEELVPLCKTNKDEVITQWDKDVIEKLGLLKMDFLGLRTLTVIDDTLTILRHQGTELDLDAVPLDDLAVYKLFCDGRTNGIFQFESAGMKNLLRSAQPSRFEDLAAFNALYRPGALSVGMVDEFIKRKRGDKKVNYILPETKPILAETYGVIAYQEQVMQIAVAVSGFTMAEADVLRKAMGKKKLEVMLEQKEKFVAGAERKGTQRRKAEELWAYIEPFAGYGFNKSHSVAYAMLAYKTAYLKTHFPAAFMAAMLTSEISDSDAVAKYVQECRDLGIPVLPPDLNVSGWAFGVEAIGDGREAIRFGLGGVKGVGEGAVEEILALRRRLGRFRDLAHLAVELDSKLVNRKVFESLVKAGTCDAMGTPRGVLLAGLDRILEYAAMRRREREAGQSSLFGAFGGGNEGEGAPVLSGPDWSERERLRSEKEALGFYLTGNPLEEHEAVLTSMSSHGTRDLRELLGDQTPGDLVVTVGGQVARLRRVKIKSGPSAGKMMANFDLEDLQGAVKVTVFADRLQRVGHLLTEEAVVLVRGSLRERGGEPELIAEDVTSLAQAVRRQLTAVEIEIEEHLPTARVLALRDLLTEHPGEVPVTLQVRLADRVVGVVPQARFRVAIDSDLVRSVEALVGPGRVREQYGPGAAA
jgi:DNA polymerase-3 subunit alpha